MFSFQLPLLALLAANRQGDSSGDAGRVALLAMMIRPPIVGLLMALAIAKQESPARFFKNPDARRVLKGLSKQDVRRLERLDDAISELQRVIDDVQDAPVRARRAAAGKRAARK